MPHDPRQIFAFSGMLQTKSDRLTNFHLTSFALTLAPRQGRRRLCYIPTGVGDSPPAIDATQATFAERRPDVEFSALSLFTRPSVPDVREHLLVRVGVILVEGGSVVNLMAVWRAHGLPAILRECWEAGVVLSGASAGSLCWHVGGPTDSYRNALDPFLDGLAFLPYSNGVHDDFTDQPRRSVYRSMVATGALPAGYASEDGVGLHYVGTELHQAVTVRESARAWSVQQNGAGDYVEHPISPSLLQADTSLQ